MLLVVDGLTLAELFISQLDGGITQTIFPLPFVVSPWGEEILSVIPGEPEPPDPTAPACAALSEEAARRYAV